MNAIATILLALGHRVSGSDKSVSAGLDRLASQGATVWAEHDSSHVEGVDAVTFSTAVPPGNCELVQALRLGIPVYPRAEVLAAICGLRRCVAVSGTHGKTTTTAMLSVALEEAGLAPSYLVGGELRGNGGAKWTGGDLIVVEADESDGTFLELPTHAAVVTSVEADHMDYFGDMQALEAAFWRFATGAKGPTVVCTDNQGSAALAARMRSEGVGDLVTYGTFGSPDFQATDIVLAGFGSSFDVVARGRTLGGYSLAVPGMHNVLDALGAIAMASQLGATGSAVRGGLASFAGVGRRFEHKGEAGGAVFVDDYAHNPGKVAAVLAAARATGAKRVVAVFQPHRYSRTAALWRELGQALAGADLVVVTGIYPAGEPPVQGVTSDLVAGAVRSAAPGLPVHLFETRDELLEHLPAMLAPGDLCLTIGAGDITTFGPQLVQAVRARSEGDNP